MRFYRRALGLSLFFSSLTFCLPLPAQETPAVPSEVVISTPAARESEQVLYEDAWTRRSRREQQWRDYGWLLIPHQANYFFPFTYNSSPHGSATNAPEYKEAKYQLSIKVLLWNEMFGRAAYLYFGYTQLAMWQVYEQNRSAPFRDINHEPELFVAMDMDRVVGPLKLRELDFGMVHQSNGVGPPDSRSWNRVYARALLDYDLFSLAIKPWLRIPDSHNRDDNPDIDRYLGYGEYTLSYYRANHVLSLMLRNNLRMDGNRGAVRVDYTFPMTRRVTGLLQYFSGYGESLLEYNRASNRFCVGLALNDWR